MMTLEEAIKHCKDVALSCTNKECALEHFQLLKWLQEYSNMLEKQGEQNQKHFELKAGHWYICHRAFCCRADHLTVKEGERFMCEKDGIVKGFVIKEPEKYFKEVCAPAPIEDEQKPVIEMKSAEESLGIDSDTYNKIVDECFGEQKPAWNEEDEKKVNGIITILKPLHKTECDYDKYKNSLIAWLKSIKNRVQPKQEWSEEDKNFMHDTLGNLTELKYRYGEGYGNVGKCIDWLKSFKDRIQPKQEWSDEDKKMLTTIVDYIISDNVLGSKYIDFLKSLRPQNTWKPSNEQMEVLVWCKPLFADPKSKSILESLINDLKKLREE